MEKKEERPRMKPELTSFDEIVEKAGWGAVFVFWFYVMTFYPSLPETIATHFNLSGEADGFGSKKMVLILPIVATVMFVALTWLNNYPHIFNYPTKITAENALQQYTFYTRLIRWVKLIIVLVFGLIAYKSIGFPVG